MHAGRDLLAAAARDGIAGAGCEHDYDIDDRRGHRAM
jgi:hypothetical protein